MPSDAFIKAASAANRQSVVLLAIESVDAVKRVVTTQTDFNAGTRININTGFETDRIRLTTDHAENVAGNYPGEVIASGVMSTVEVRGALAIDGGDGESLYYCSVTTPVFLSQTLIDAITVNFRGFVDFPGVIAFPGDKVGVLEGLSDGYPDWIRLSAINLSDGEQCSITYSDCWQHTGWSFRVRMEYVATMNLNTAVVVDSYQETHTTRYLTAGYIITAPDAFDFGATPAIPSRLELDDNINTGCSITYTAWGRDTAVATWAALGTVADGGSLPAYRYYQIKADLTASPDGMATPIISEIRIVGGNSQYTYLSTHKDLPVRGALPYIVPGGISSISSKIDLAQQATVGELTAKLYWRKKVGDMIAGDWIKNKTIICKLGFVGLSEVDYEPYFVGSWYDYQADSEKGIITVKTRNILKRFNKKIPEAAEFANDDGTKKPDTFYIEYAGNVMSVMLTLADALGIPDRLLDKSSFTDLAAGSRSGTDWNVARKVKAPTDAMEMLNELSVSSGVFLFEGADGRLTAKLYDDFAAATPTVTLDAKHYKFRAVDGGQKDLSTRQAIYYNLISGKDGGSATDYLNVLIDTNADAELAWEETNTREWFDKWYLTDVAVQKLAKRWASWFSVPRPTVRVDDVPPRYHSIERGQVVAVDNLQLPCPAGDWQGYTDGTRFLVMGKSISDPTSGNLTVSFDLMLIDDNIVFETDPNFPHYSRLDYWPAVRQLTAVTRIDSSTVIPQGYIDVSFSDPLNFQSGDAVVWMRTNNGAWVMYRVLPFGLEDLIKRLSIPVNAGDTIEIRITTLRPDGQQTPIDLAPVVIIDVPPQALEPSGLLKFINGDISTDKLAQYLNKEISLTALMETVNAAVAAGALADGSIGFLPDVVYSFSRDIVLQAGKIGEQSAILEILKDQATLQLTSNGHVAGLTIGWDDSGDQSEVVFLQDVFKICLPDGTGIKNAFTVGTISGQTVVGISGDLIVDGAIAARHLSVGALTVGVNVGLGTAVSSDDITTIVGGVISTHALNADNITAGTLSVDFLDLSGDVVTVPDNTTLLDITTDSSSHLWYSVPFTIDPDTVNRPMYFTFYAESSAAGFFILRFFEPGGTPVKLFYCPTIAAGSVNLANMSNAFKPTTTGQYYVHVEHWVGDGTAVSNGNFFTFVSKR